jgi:hypothetical protein
MPGYYFLTSVPWAVAIGRHAAGQSLCRSHPRRRRRARGRGHLEANQGGALAAAKGRGTQLGGRRGSAERFAEIGFVGRQVKTENADKRAADLLPVIRELQTAGATSLRQIAAGLNERNISTPRGGEFSAVQVQRVLTATRWYRVSQEGAQRLCERAKQA